MMQPEALNCLDNCLVNFSLSLSPAISSNLVSSTLTYSRAKIKDRALLFVERRFPSMRRCNQNMQAVSKFCTHIFLSLFLPSSSFLLLYFVVVVFSQSCSNPGCTFAYFSFSLSLSPKTRKLQRKK